MNQGHCPNGGKIDVLFRSGDPRPEQCSSQHRRVRHTRHMASGDDYLLLSPTHVKVSVETIKLLLLNETLARRVIQIFRRNETLGAEQE
jgi:hypothetical protein